MVRTHMSDRRRRTALSAIALLLGAVLWGGTLLTASPASAGTVPFQIQSASFGNPGGSFDVPPIHCGIEVGRAAGVVTITGTLPGRWGCMSSASVTWVNVTTMTTGTAQMSNGLNGFPPEAVIRTGVGQVGIKIDALSGIITPGLTTLWVP